MKKFISMMITLFFMVASMFASVNRGFDVKYQRVSSDVMQLDFTTDFSITTVEKDGVMYSKISGAGSIVTNDKGFAELPYHASAVQLNNNKNVTLKYSSENFEDIVLDHPLLPSRGTIYRNQNPEEIPYEISSESKISETTYPFILRDVRGTNVIVYPYQYNAVTNTLRIYKTLSVSLIENETDTINPLSKSASTIVSEMNGVYKSLFINYNDESKFANQIGEMGEILVIYTSRDASVIQPYIDWKRENGFVVNKTEVLTGTNVVSTVQNAYDANNNILYVQLVGDWADIKCDTGGGEDQPMDPEIGCVVGTDDYADIIIGRFSAETTAQVTVQINKAINYEKNPDIGGTWYKTGLGIGGDDGGTGADDDETDWEQVDVIKQNKLIPYTYGNVNEAYHSPSATTVANFVNAGLGIINYCGHGAPTYWGTSLYDNDDVYASTNGSKLPFIFSVACVNGSFDDAVEVFAEAWLRKENGGAVATLMSTINQPWNPPMIGQDYFNDILTEGYDYSSNPGSGTSTTDVDHRTTFGSIVFNGCILALAETPSDISMLNTIKTWTIFGDASLQIRTDTPTLIDNSNGLVIPVGNYSTTITTTSGSNPVEGAKVTLYQNGTSYTALTNANGDVSIDHGFTVGDVTLTVTGYNLETEQSIVPIDDSGLTPPKSLIASAHQKDVYLSWTAPSKALSSYKVYRDDVNIATVGTTSYIDLNRPEATYEYYITAVYTGDPAGESYSSNKVNVNVVQFPVPTNFAAVIGNNWDTAALTWDAPFKALVDYDVYRNGSYLATTTNNYYNDSGLSEATYSYYIKATYSDPGTSAATPTLQVEIKAPLYPSANSFSFENGGSIPADWSDEGEWAYITSGTSPSGPAEGSYYAHMNSGGSSKIITPKFDMSQYENVTLNFKYVVTYERRQSNNWYDNLQVYYMDATSKAGWVALGSVYTGNYTTWQTASIPLGNEILSNDFYIAFEGINVSNAAGVSVDDIVINGTFVGGPVVPGTPSNVSTSISGTDLVIDWDAAADATSYDVYSSDDPYGSFTYVTNVPTNQYTVDYTAAKKFYYVVAKNATK